MSHATNGKWSYFPRDPKAGHVHSKENASHEEFVEQKLAVRKILESEHLMNEARLEQEVEWYYCNLGINRNYFIYNSEAEIANHISSLYSAKCLAEINGNDLELQLKSDSQGKAFYIVRSIMDQAKDSPYQPIEHQIEETYLGLGFENRKFKTEKKPELMYNVFCYRTSGTISPESPIHLRMYLLIEPKFKVQQAPLTESNLDDIADLEFLSNLLPESRKFYTEIMAEAVVKMNPVIRIQQEGQEQHLVIAFRAGSTHSFFSGVTDLYRSFGQYSSRKFVHQFSNRMIFFSIYLLPRSPQLALNESSMAEMVEAVNLIYILPRTSLQSLIREGVLTPKEYCYTYVGWKFAFHFLSRQSAEFAELAQALKSNALGHKLLEQIKKTVKKEAYTESRIMEVLLEYTDIIKQLYQQFELKHSKSEKTNPNPNDEAIQNLIKKTVSSEFDREVLKAFTTFNKHILKTNFFKPNKIALSFRLDPAFLSKDEYPLTPFAIFMLVGPEFRGFHIRFRDIARGGIRSIVSRNWQSYIQNVTTLFDENYNLANTQERKNKDIAEGGSKGTILLSLDHPDKAFVAFQKYVDCLLDLLLPDPWIIDYYNKEEVLFLGPDEGTADFMDWASAHAKSRGYKYWKAFTTGKSLDRGGIPHDKFGMTTRSVHAYVVGVLDKLGLKEDECTKFQTGGPDGDLGSNEIKISKDKTIGIVDGSGVLYDPVGIDKTELVHVAAQRKMARFFDKSKLSPKGFFVDIEDNDVKLPDGTFVSNGMDFRNSFHLNPLAAADIFVPCGGRPESVNLNNVQSLLDETTKKPRYKVIVEGANLFFTNDSRRFLEERGVILFKDASANKGGVTSSSLEVLAALSLTDEEFEKHMAVKGEVPPPFYSAYVTEVQQKIEENAKLEFQCIWSEHEKTGTSRGDLSDIISNKINELSAAISNSDLWDNAHLRKTILSEACPKQLLTLLSLEQILERIPESYGRALFGCFLASRYVYTCGLSATPEFAFFDFLQTYIKK